MARMVVKSFAFKMKEGKIARERLRDSDNNVPIYFESLK
jgi:hypothetical protein